MTKKTEEQDEEDDEVVIAAYWGPRKASAREVVDLCFRLLERLRSISGLFEDFLTAFEGDTKPTAVPRDFSSFTELVVRTFQDPESYFENPDPLNKELTLESTSPTGFVTWFRTVQQESSIGVWVGAGIDEDFGCSNFVNIKIPQGRQSALLEPATARALMLALVELFEPDYATAYTHTLHRALGGADYTGYFGVWMHLRDHQVPNFSSPLARVEFGVAGGTLIHFGVPLPWHKHAEELRSAFDACRAANIPG